MRRLLTFGKLVANAAASALLLPVFLLPGRAQWVTGRAREIRLWLAAGILAGSAPLSLATVLISGPAVAPVPATVPEVEGRSGPVVLLAIEGASFAAILPLASEGKLPNFARMLKEGSRGPLRTLRPCRSAVAWASLATGKLPARHGIKDLKRYRLGSIPGELRLLPEGLLLRRWLAPLGLTGRSSGESDLRARPLWTILDLLRVEAVFLGWPLETGGRQRGLEEESGDRLGRTKEWLSRIAGGSALTVAQDRGL